MTRDFCQNLASRAKTVEARQALFRREALPRLYSGKLHLLFTAIVALGCAGGCSLAISSWDFVVLGSVLATIFVAMTLIYLGHRFPMHRPVPGLLPIYELHTRCHHMLFDYGRTEIRETDDAYMVMLPPWLTVALCVAIYPALSLVMLLISPDAFWASVGTYCLYLLTYELVHLAAHAPPEYGLSGVPVLGALLEHHQRHHAWSEMHHGNFSMLFPVWDWVLGTKLRPSPPVGQGANSSSEPVP